MSTPNKSRLQGRFAPGRPYGRPSLKRYGASESLLSTQSGHSISPVQQSDSVKIVLRDKR
jgi:hypothetical protein